MILVDTTVWIDHLRAGDEHLVSLLNTVRRGCAMRPRNAMDFIRYQGVAGSFPYGRRVTSWNCS